MNKDHFTTLTNVTAKIKSNNIIFMGDFNSRTSDLDDTIQKEKHDENLQDFYSTILAHKRNNQDQTINNYGKKLTEFCISSGCFIANGRTLGDFQGNLTCHTANGSSTVDYAILNQSLHKELRLFQVLHSTIGSDHCPIKVELRTRTPTMKAPTTVPLPKQPKWNEITKSLLENRMGSLEVSKIIGEIDNLLEKDEQNINLIAEKVSEIYTIEKKTPRPYHKKKYRKRTQVKKKWYDQTCEEMGRKLKDVTKLLAKR